MNRLWFVLFDRNCAVYCNMVSLSSKGATFLRHAISSPSTDFIVNYKKKGANCIRIVSFRRKIGKLRVTTATVQPQ